MEKVLLGLIAGIAFGFVIQRVGATNSDKMAKAHLMIEPQIPQFMLLAVIFAAIGVFGLKLAGIGRFMPLPTSICGHRPGGHYLRGRLGHDRILSGNLLGGGRGRTGGCHRTLLGGFVGTAVFAHFHETLVPLLYAPTNIGQITLDAWLKPPVFALILLTIVFSVGMMAIGKIWKKDESLS